MDTPRVVVAVPHIHRLTHGERYAGRPQTCVKPSVTPREPEHRLRDEVQSHLLADRCEPAVAPHASTARRGTPSRRRGHRGSERLIGSAPAHLGRRSRNCRSISAGCGTCNSVTIAAIDAARSGGFIATTPGRQGTAPIRTGGRGDTATLSTAVAAVAWAVIPMRHSTVSEPSASRSRSATSARRSSRGR